MTSLFRARRSEEPGSGGKMLRGRRPAASASPYARPDASPAAAQSGSPRWLSGLISGAGKLISSVLPSSYQSSASPSSSSVYSSDEDASSGNNADEKGLQRLNQRGNELALVNKCMDGKLAIVPKSETKLAIEQLLMQETFSRDECDKLTKLIQSRVVDFPSPEAFGGGAEELRRTISSDVLPGSFSSFGQKKKSLLERVHYSCSKLNDFSPGSSLFEACTPDICNKAVSEAKKWFEEKKLEAKQKYDSECGPCTLNTDMLQYGIEGEEGSPVDMAKSYMRSLPPWRSPSFSGIGFKTPPPSGIRRYREETAFEAVNSSSVSSKGLKRDRLFLGAWDTLDESCLVRLKSAKVSELETVKSSLEVDRRELHSEDHSTDGALRLPDERDDGTQHPFKIGNLDSSNIVSELEVATDAVHSSHGISIPNTLEPTKILDENQPSRAMDEVDNDFAPHNALASASRLMETDENPSSEIKVTSTENIKLAVPSNPDDAVELNDVHSFDMQKGAGVGRTIISDSCSSQLNTVSGTAETNCSSDSRPQDGNSHAPKKANGAVNESSANGSSAEVDKTFNNETRSKGADTILPQNGTRMKSIERMLTEPQPAAGRRGKKVVGKSRRGRKT